MSEPRASTAGEGYGDGGGLEEAPPPPPAQDEAGRCKLGPGLKAPTGSKLPTKVLNLKTEINAFQL